jgi:Flp pilus assembly pilin Flp
MKNIFNFGSEFRILTDRQGHDIVEYALLAGFLAVVAGAIVPGAASEISKILSKLPSLIPAGATHGSVR